MNQVVVHMTFYMVGQSAEHPSSCAVVNRVLASGHGVRNYLLRRHEIPRDFINFSFPLSCLCHVVNFCVPPGLVIFYGCLWHVVNFYVPLVNFCVSLSCVCHVANFYVLLGI